MTQVIILSKLTKNALTATDPNDFIYHSQYNTFKIIAEATTQVSLSASTNNQSFNVAHGLSFVPLVSGFCKVSGESQAYPPNCQGVVVATLKSIIRNGVKFNYISADATNITFNFDNTNGSTKTVDIRYFILEAVV